MECIFCKIVAGAIPARKLYEDDELLAFADIAPAAPVHLLVIPKRHIRSLMEADAEPGGNAGKPDAALMGSLMAAAVRLAEDQKLEKGFRVVINTGDDGGQTVHHLHLHVLGGRAMHWPPG